jgi:hypothetical protein
LVTHTILAAAAHWDNDVGGGALALLRHRVPAFEPLELRAGAILDELSHRATLDASLFSAMLPGLTWNAGAHAGEDRIRRFDDHVVAGTERLRRAGGWAGAERHGAWFLSLLGRAEHVRHADAALDGWAVGPYLRATRPLEPDAVVGIPLLLEAELRGGSAGYARARGSIGTTHTLFGVPAAAFLDVAATGRSAPADALPAARRELVPWLRTGALRSPSLAVAGADLAVPVVLDGFLRFRVRAVAAGQDLEDLRTTRRWLGGAEVGLAWPTVVGPLELALAGGAGGRRLNLSIGTPP